MTRPDRFGSGRLAALTELLRGTVKPPTAVELDQGLNRLRARAARKSARPVALRTSLVAAALFSLVLLGAALVPRLFGRSKALVLPVVVSRVEGGKILDGGYVSEVGHAGVQLYFSEGSKFVFTPGTRGRLRALTPEGARLVLDRGTASFQVARSIERRWWVEAGPFVISVRGTEFTVAWDPTSERFEVMLRHGRVAVSGPVVGAELILQPGQNLSVNLAKGETLISQGRAENSPETGPSEVASQASASAPPNPLPSAAPVAPSPQGSASPPTASARRWREALANGEWDRILADVERDGVEASIRTLSSDELFALADAARYRRRPDLARAALLAQRERFPNSSRALDAIFLLGRVEEMRAAGRTAAISRYDEYLGRAPAGTYAAEALGRKMILVKEIQGPKSAGKVAEEYLRRFPSGSYAEAARSLERIP